MLILILGDRIVSITVFLEKMVYEDALTILSYASPYKVRLEVEKPKSNTENVTSNTLTKKSSASAVTGQKLIHPLYRSQSLEDLHISTTIERKEQSLSEKSTGSAGKNIVQKIKSHLLNRSCRSNKSNSSLDPSKAVYIIEEMDTHGKEQIMEEMTETNKLALGKNAKATNHTSNEPKMDNVNVIQIETDTIIGEEESSNRRNDVEIKGKRDATAVFQENIKPVSVAPSDALNDELLNKEESKGRAQQVQIQPQPVPRKAATPAKRKGKAPQPPVALVPQIIPQTEAAVKDSSVETTVLIHQEPIREEPMKTDESQDVKSEEVKKEIVLITSASEVDHETAVKAAERQHSVSLLSSDTEHDIVIINGKISSSSDESINKDEKSSGDLLIGDEAGTSHSSDATLELEVTVSGTPQRVQSPCGKPKSSSLGDLTNVNNPNNANYKQVVSTLLERAVSLDLQAQTLPEENLSQHGKNLRVPSDVSNADSMPLKKWDANELNEVNLSNDTTDSSENALNDAAKIDANGNVYQVKDLQISRLYIEDPAENASNLITDSSDEESPPEIKNEYNGTECAADAIEREAKHKVSLMMNGNSYDTSTPVANKSRSAIEEYIKLDVSSSDEESESTMTDANKEADLPSQVESVANEEFVQKCEEEQNNNKMKENKEVIEITPSELDGVMMSHRAFLLKQAISTGVYTNIPPATNSSPNISESNMDFESWSYVSDDGTINDVNNANANNTSFAVTTANSSSSSGNYSDQSHYNTALDITFAERIKPSTMSSTTNTTTTPSKTPPRSRIPEISGITLKSSERGRLSQNVVISPLGNTKRKNKSLIPSLASTNAATSLPTAKSSPDLSYRY